MPALFEGANDVLVSYAILGGVVVGASWYLGRLALGPTGSLSVSFILLFASSEMVPSSHLDQEQPNSLEHYQT